MAFAKSGIVYFLGIMETFRPRPFAAPAVTGPMQATLTHLKSLFISTFLKREAKFSTVDDDVNVATSIFPSFKSLFILPASLTGLTVSYVVTTSILPPKRRISVGVTSLA